MTFHKSLAAGTILFLSVAAACGSNSENEGLSTDTNNTEEVETSSETEELNENNEDEENSSDPEQTNNSVETEAVPEEESVSEIREEYETELEELEIQLQNSESEIQSLEQELENTEEELAEAEGTDNADAPSLREEGFYEQLWMNENSLAPMEGWEPGTTDWRETAVEADGPFLPGESQYSSPERLVFDWLSARGTLEQTNNFEELAVRTKFEDNSSAEILILEWGLRDDAAAGHDILIHLSEENSVWGITEMEERYHCRRGISEVDGEELCN